MNNVPDFIMKGENSGFGNFVSTAGDINGDGFSDIIVGAPFLNNLGGAYVFYNLSNKPTLINPLNNSFNNYIPTIFNWSKFDSALFYILNVSTDSTFNIINIKDTIYHDTLKTLSGLQISTKYYWRVGVKDTSGKFYYSKTWNFKTISFQTIKLKVLIEGMYYPVFNQMTRSDTVKIYLRNSVSPYALIDSAKGIIDSISLSNTFTFNNTANGTYYLVVKHFNSIETWSKAGGETLTSNGSIYNYDFSTAFSQAYGNNLKKKGTKYCMFSGDVNQDGIIDAADMQLVDNDAFESLGGYVASDVNGDYFVDASDLFIIDNNAYISIIVVTP
ncbi:MAG: FG-GAP repeat protein [Ignavibacteria bacterium]|nr:FG-GAP repeat protein [Ignavibacteria bacterium]